MPIAFRNCAPTDLLGFPAYYRVTFQRHAVDLEAQLPNVVKGVSDSLDPSIAGAVGPGVVYAPGDQAALLLLATTAGSGSTVTVERLVQLLDPTPFWGYWPSFLTAVSIAAIERVSASEILDDGATEAARMAANASAEAGDPLTRLADGVKLLGVVLVVVVVAWTVARLAAAARGARQR